MYETKPYAYFKFEMLTNHLKENYLSIFFTRNENLQLLNSYELFLVFFKMEK